MLYAREAAEFSTEYQMMDMEFAVNHYGQPDVAMFDFTSMYAAENASRVIERRGHRLFMTLVGDSLLEVRVAIIFLCFECVGDRIRLHNSEIMLVSNINDL